MGLMINKSYFLFGGMPPF